MSKNKNKKVRFSKKISISYFDKNEHNLVKTKTKTKRKKQKLSNLRYNKSIKLR
jgi:hypothetical protein